MSLKEPVSYETDNFPYKVKYMSTYSVMESTAKEILDSSEKFLGFDTEMADSRNNIDFLVRNTTGEGTFMPTLVIQLCTSNTVYLFHLYEVYDQYLKTGTLLFPPSLRKILSSEIIVKVGFTTHNDTLALFKTYGINISKLFDIDTLATSLRLGFNSLKDLVIISKLPYQLKGKDDSHDWTRNLTYPTMRTGDIEYAALDAIVCLELHKELISSSICLTPGTNESDENITRWLKAKNNTKTGDELRKYIATAFPPWQRILSMEERSRYATDYVDRVVIAVSG